eukprot:1270855-Prymnesium_polylepis.1
MISKTSGPQKKLAPRLNCPSVTPATRGATANIATVWSMTPTAKYRYRESCQDAEPPAAPREATTRRICVSKMEQADNGWVTGRYHTSDAGCSKAGSYVQAEKWSTWSTWMPARPAVDVEGWFAVVHPVWRVEGWFQVVHPDYILIGVSRDGSRWCIPAVIGWSTPSDATCTSR